MSFTVFISAIKLKEIEAEQGSVCVHDALTEINTFNAHEQRCITIIMNTSVVVCWYNYHFHNRNEIVQHMHVCYVFFRSQLRISQSFVL